MSKFQNVRLCYDDLKMNLRDHFIEIKSSNEREELMPFTGNDPVQYANLHMTFSFMNIFSTFFLESGIIFSKSILLLSIIEKSLLWTLQGRMILHECH